MIIYLVLGDCGEYSDRRDWIVCAFYDEEQAKGRVEELRVELERIHSELHIAEHEWIRLDGDFAVHRLNDESKVETKLATLDPHFRSDYTGTSYSVITTELYGAVDTFLAERKIEVQK